MTHPNVPPIETTLIENLEALIAGAPTSEKYVSGVDEGVRQCIAIIRTHQAAEREKLREIRDTMAKCVDALYRGGDFPKTAREAADALATLDELLKE